MKNIITILTTLIIIFLSFSNNALADIKGTTNPQEEAQKSWSYYRSSQRDLSGEVFVDEASCMNASSNNPFADKSRFDSTWQNCFISDKNGKPLEEDTYYFQNTDNGTIQVNPRAAKSKPSWEKYTLLAPFAGFEEAPDNVGDYLNKIFIIGIALCGALAVVMLIISGIQYMGEESIFGKSKWREQMKNALYGLLIALSAYALLNTIDPRLLGGGGVNIRAVTIEVDPEVHGDTPHSAVNGKYCNGKYAANSDWPSDATERSLLQKAGITINKINCTKVGQTNCTSLSGLNTASVINLKKTCPSCEIVITGGTECWLHSPSTLHLPGNSIVDLRTTTSLISYVESDNTQAQTKGMNYPVFIKNNTKFMKEPNGHYHIINW